MHALQSDDGPSRERSTSPTGSMASAASSIRSWSRKFNARFPPNTSNNRNNHRWRKTESVYSTDDDEGSVKLPPKPAPRRNSINSTKIQQLKSFNYKFFEHIDISSVEEKTFESTRVDWFGVLKGRFSGKSVPLKFYHQPDLSTLPSLDLMIAHTEDKLYLPVGINEHINEILYYIMTDYIKPSIFMKMCSNIQFVSSRMEIAQLLAVPYLHSQFFCYNPNFGFDVVAVRQQNKIYMCMFFSEEEKFSRKLDFATQRLQQSNVGGLMFQKYLLSDSPHDPPNVKAPYDRKESEYFVVDEVTINGNHKILLLNKFKAVNNESDLENLKDFELFDIKTTAKPYKLRNVFQKWTRCLAGNMEKMVMGIKSRDASQVTAVEVVTRCELLDMCQKLYAEEMKKQCGNAEFSLHPQPQICFDFLENFLTFMGKTVNKDTAWDEVYKFEIRPAENAGVIRVEKLTGKFSSPYNFMDNKFREWLKK